MQLEKFTSVIVLFLFSLSLCYCYQINSGRSHFLYTDFGKFYQSAQFFDQGKNIYTKIFLSQKETTNSGIQTHIKQAAPDLNPPFFTLLVLPLGLLTYSSALLLWSALSIAGGILSIILLQKALKLNDPPIYLTLSFILAFFVYYPTFAVIQFGQVTLVLLPLVVAAWLSAKNKYLATAGILLGIVASLKIIFGLFLIYFLMRREWRATIAFIATIIICSLIPLLFFGTKSYVDYYQIIHHIHWYASNWNASLLGFLFRLFGSHENNASVFAIPHLANILFWLLSIILLLTFIKYLFPNNKLNQQTKLDLDFSMTLVVMLILSPLGWLYYFPFLLIPFVVCVQLAQRSPHTRYLQILIAIAIALSGITSMFTSSEHITAANITAIFISSSCYVSTLIILLGVLFFLRYTLAQSPIRKTIGFSAILTYTIALVPSLFSILLLINQGALFGEHFVLNFDTVYFGS